MSWWYNRRPRVSIAASRAKAQREIDRLEKQGRRIQPVEIAGTKIANTFWGKGWCDHLEGFSDYENRLPRGRRYVRNGSVVHLEIEQGRILALVSGTDLYKVEITINTMPEGKWRYIQKRCTGRIASLMALLEGRFSDDVMRVVTDPEEGLFPLPGEIRFQCSCPDWAVMCKHVAATLYGVGARLDADPSLLFRLRNVDHEILLQGEAIAAVTTAVETGGMRRRFEGDIGEVFGIDLDDVAEALGPGEAPPPKRTSKQAATPKKEAARKTAKRKATPQAVDRLPGLDADGLQNEITGPWIREIRERAFEMTKSRFAMILEVSPATVTAWEKRTSTLTFSRRVEQRLEVLLPNSRGDALSMDARRVANAIEKWAMERYGLKPSPRVVDGQFIAGLREGFDMSRKELATLIGVAPQKVAAWERRKTPLPAGAYRKVAAIVTIDIGEAWDRVIN